MRPKTFSVLNDGIQTAFRDRVNHWLTSAGASVGGHDVALGGAGAPVAAGHVHTLEGAEVPDALGAFIDVWGRRTQVTSEERESDRKSIEAVLSALRRPGSMTLKPLVYGLQIICYEYKPSTFTYSFFPLSILYVLT